jgi:hypothetical protein
MDGVTLSMTRAVVDAQEAQVASQRATQLVELQRRESLRVETDQQLRETRAMWGAGQTRRAPAGRSVEASEEREEGRPRRRGIVNRRGIRRDADTPARSIDSPAAVDVHPLLGTRLDIRT